MTSYFKSAVLSAAAFSWLMIGKKTGQLSIFMDGNAGWRNTIIFFVLLLFFHSTNPQQKKTKKPVLFVILAIVVSCLVSISGIAGIIYNRDNVIGLINTIREAKLNLIIFPIAFLGGIILCFRMICLLEYEGKRLISGSRSFLVVNRLCRFFLEGHAVLKQLLFLLLIWTPQVIIRYPGVAMIDALNSLSQYYGQNPYTSKHPTIFAVLFGFFVDLGKRLGSANLGLFLLVLVQTALLILTILYTIHMMRKLGLPDIICLAAYIILLLAPSTITSATVVMKDTAFCIAFLLLSDELAWFMFCPERNRIHPVHLALTFLACCGLFFRHDGIYIVLFLAAVLAAAEAVLTLRNRKRLTVGIAAFVLTLLCAFGSGELLTKYLNRKYQVQQISTRVILSLPIQQVSRYMCVYGGEITPEEEKTLRKVLDLSAEGFKEHYQPLNFDGVKLYFVKDASGEDIAGFLKLWLTFIRRHPAVCVDATLNQNYLLFSPLINKENYFTHLTNYLTTSNLEYSYDFTDLFHDVDRLYGFQERLLNYYDDFGGIPLLGLMTNTGLHTILLLAVTIYALVQRRGRLLLLLAPPLMILAFTFVGPAISGNLRYVFPIMWTMPLWAGVFLGDVDKNRKGELV